MQAKTGWKAGHVFYCQASKHCKHRSNSQAEYKSHMKLKHKSPHVRTLIPCMRCNYVAELTVMATRHRALHMRLVISLLHKHSQLILAEDSSKGIAAMPLISVCCVIWSCVPILLMEVSRSRSAESYFFNWLG